MENQLQNETSTYMLPIFKPTTSHRETLVALCVTDCIKSWVLQKVTIQVDFETDNGPMGYPFMALTQGPAFQQCKWSQTLL